MSGGWMGWHFVMNIVLGKPLVPKTGVPSATALLGFLEGGGAVELQNSMRGMGGPHTHTYTHTHKRTVVQITRGL